MPAGNAKPVSFLKHHADQNLSVAVETALGKIEEKAGKGELSAIDYAQDIIQISHEGYAAAVILTKVLGALGVAILPLVTLFTPFLYQGPLKNRAVAAVGDVSWSEGEPVVDTGEAPTKLLNLQLAHEHDSLGFLVLT